MDVAAGSWIAGADEVGRGALAGPVYAAAVIFPPGRKLRGLDDSKKLTAEAREALVPRIQVRAVAWAIATASLAEIERLNILHASLLAMQRAVAALAVAPALLRVDGVHCPAVACSVEAIVGGDGKVPAIMAASVLAKVARDAEMRRLDLEHPGYGFAEHKGYATPQHLEALQRLGPCAVHRRLFEPVLQMKLELA
ncbi:MAG: ribonuclease HII [Nevskiaceae bacterium]